MPIKTHQGHSPKRGRYPRKCKGRLGPHTILSEDDEMRAPNGYLSCKICHRAARKGQKELWRGKNWAKELNTQNRRRRRQSERRQEAELHETST